MSPVLYVILALTCAGLYLILGRLIREAYEHTRSQGRQQ